MIVVPPPVPAPYLADVPPLPDALIELLNQRRLSPAERRYVAKTIADRRLRLRVARTVYESVQHVRIAPELQHVS